MLHTFRYISIFFPDGPLVLNGGNWIFGIEDQFSFLKKLICQYIPQHDKARTKKEMDILSKTEFVSRMFQFGQAKRTLFH